MSWSLMAIPLCTALSNAEAVAWLASRDVPGLVEPPTPHPLPTVEQFLAVVEQRGLHGTAWFAVEGSGANGGMRRCADMRAGLYLGEVTLLPPGSKPISIGAPSEPPPALTLKTPIEFMDFRKPRPLAVFMLAVELARRSGPLLVLDDDMNHPRVAAAGGDARALAAPWGPDDGDD